MTPSPTSTAIPLGCFMSSNVFSIGTGFLARHKGNIALITAAHTPTRDQPTTEWTKWPLKMLTFTTQTTQISTSLFIEIGANRYPNFRFAESHPPRIADMMAFMGISHQNMLTQLEARYPVIDFSHANSAPELGDNLTCYGYPDILQTQWPYIPAYSSSGPFIRSTGWMFEAQMPSQVGQSGGPVFDSSNRFIGMLIGSTDGITNIVPTTTLAMLWP